MKLHHFKNLALMYGWQISNYILSFLLLPYLARTLNTSGFGVYAYCVGINAYLWRASLDTLSFMPMLQTDSNGGVIVTDWYTNPQNPAERMKVTVSILDQDLRADALRVNASREVMSGGQWVGAPVQAATVQKLEDIILTRAREMRRDALMG